jgi:TetR/AcrR family transcriptional repressor of nem operon
VKVSRKQADENRQRILDAASRLFREKGFDGIGLDGIMKEAGLTHGGFYGHFASKADLAAEASAEALGNSVRHWRSLTGPDGGGLADLVRAYLSPQHRDHPDRGCALAALGAEVPRQGDALRRSMTEAVAAKLDILAEAIDVPDDETRRRARAIETLCGMVGALVLARAVETPLSDELLDSAAASFGGSASQT